MSEEFAGKACVMTGAGGGMGLAIARVLRAEGCAVTAIDPKPEPPEFAEGDGAAGRYVEGDATDEALVARTVADAFDASAGGSTIWSMPPASAGTTGTAPSPTWRWRSGTG